MNASRFLYRSRQFWQALSTGPSQEDVELVSSVLTDPQLELFLGMQASEQTHSIQVFNELRNQGEKNPDLLAAALLHDVGKTRAPLRIWERVMIVIVGAVCENCLHKWAGGGHSLSLSSILLGAQTWLPNAAHRRWLCH